VISTADFKKGRKIQYKGAPCEIIDFLHAKMGRGGALVKTKLKNLISGAVLEDTFRSGEKFEPANLEEKSMQYLYESDGTFHFMDTESYEQITLTEEQFSEAKKWTKDNTIVTVLYFKDNPISIDPPMFVELEVTETEPGFKGDTASGGSKPAIVETGAQIKVPFHINIGDKLKIDTRTGDYIERVK
jgi:elongation factor P